MIDISYSLCSQCNGSGIITAPEASLVCPQCCGGGGWLLTNKDQRLIYPFKLTLEAKDTTKNVRIAWFIVTGIGALITLGSLIMMLGSSWPSLGSFLWQNQPANVIFGLAGLTTMAGVAMVEQLHTSEESLHNLSLILDAQEPNSTLSLQPYANARVKQVFLEAVRISQNYGSATLEPDHLLAALLDQPRIQLMISRLELSSTDLRDELITHLVKDTAKSNPVSISPSVKEHLLQGFAQAITHDFPFLDIEDLLLSFLTSNSTTDAYYKQLFDAHGITASKYYAVTLWYAAEQDNLRSWRFWRDKGRMHSKTYMNRGWTALPTPFTDSFSTDLTLMASYGNVTSIQTRLAEINEALIVLGSNTVRNVLFIGEPGSGIEEILPAMATQLLEEDIPENLMDRRFINLDLPRLLTSDGGAQANMQRVLNEIGTAGNVILAIPDVQSLADSTKAQLDGSSILANALKNNVVQIISTATYADYHRYVEQNSLLTSLLQVIELHPLTAEEALLVLEESTSSLEAQYSIRVTYPALEASVSMAMQYMPDEALPQSALRLLEKAANSIGSNGKHWVDQAAINLSVESLAHVPVAQAEGEEAEKLLNLENLLHERVIGQELAVHAVSEALRRARTGLNNAERPLGSFMFVGPTGVGKTELAKALCEVYFKPENHMTRFDMSEYQDPKSVYNLIGAPTTGSNIVEGGELTQAVREHPFGLLLFDEIEKAHPDVLNLFLQILDDGRITENTGKTIHLNTCIIIATSNAGSNMISQLIKSGSNLDQLTPQIMQALESQFKPEFLNRFDGIIPFQPLIKSELDQIAQLMINEIIAKAKAQKIELTISPEARTKLVTLGYNPAYGARPLRRTIEQKVEGILSKKMLSKEVTAGGSLQITPEMID